MTKEQEKERFIEELKKIGRPEANIELEQGPALSPFSSKLGGKPVVPKDFKWPSYQVEWLGDVDADKHRPLSFLAQFNLEEVKQYDKENLLPPKGILSIFYCFEYNNEGGFLDGPDSHDCLKVYYFEDISALSVMDYPVNISNEYIIDEKAMKFKEVMSFPSWDDFEVPGLSDENNVYYDCQEELGYPYELSRIKLLGYPRLIQGSLGPEAELYSRGSDFEDYYDFSEDEKKDIANKAKDWRLLFEIGQYTFDDKFFLGDGADLYVMIREDDLKNRRFDTCWALSQGY